MRGLAAGQIRPAGTHSCYLTGGAAHDSVCTGSPRPELPPGRSAVAYEFGFDVVRVEVEELDVGPDEPREFIIEALAGEVAAHISTDLQGLGQLLEEIEREEHQPGYRPGQAWEPQLPQMRGFFFHPRIVMSAVQ